MHRPYTADEDRALLTRPGRTSLATLARRLGRSPDALRMRLALRHGWRGIDSPKAQAIRAAGMSRSAVAQALGVTEKTVGNWCRGGLLHEHKTLAITRAFSSIDAEDVTAFLRAGGALLDCLRPTDPIWREIVMDIRADLRARYISAADLAAALGLSVLSLAYLRQRHGMPGPAIRQRGALPSWYDRADLRAWLAAHPQYRTRGAEAL